MVRIGTRCCFWVPTSFAGHFRLVRGAIANLSLYHDTPTWKMHQGDSSLLPSRCVTRRRDREERWRNLIDPVALSLGHGRIVIPSDVVRHSGPRLALNFHPDRAGRLLIVHLFTGAYHQDVESISIPRVFRTLVKVVVS